MEINIDVKVLDAISTYSPKLDYKNILEFILTLKSYMIDNKIKNLQIDSIEINLVDDAEFIEEI